MELRRTPEPVEPERPRKGLWTNAEPVEQEQASMELRRTPEPVEPERPEPVSGPGEREPVPVEPERPEPVNGGIGTMK
jgi:hypothetical protein